MAIQLYIACRRCNRRFKRHLSGAPTDITIKCPFCSSFALALTEVPAEKPSTHYPRPPKTTGRGRRKKV